MCDGRNWRPNEGVYGSDGFLSIWIAGLPENADRHNLQVRLAGTKLDIRDLNPDNGEGHRQINAELRRPIPPGEQDLVASIGGVQSTPIPVVVKHENSL